VEGGSADWEALVEALVATAATAASAEDAERTAQATTNRLAVFWGRRCTPERSLRLFRPNLF
jgi:hypothetical protein